MILPTAEIVCLGNELLIGITINTNATFLGEQLTKLGYEVRRVTSIRDDLDLAVEFFHELLERKPDIVIISGGLGPTYDDIQLEVVSKATELELQENSEALKQIETYYNKRDLQLTKERKKMSFLPAGSKVLSNNVGGAPGCHFLYRNIEFFCLPGVPTEMKDIFLTHILPHLKSKENHQLFEKKFQVLNCAESELAPYINEVKGDYPDLYIKSHPAYEGKAGIVIHVSSYGKSAEVDVNNAIILLKDCFNNNLKNCKIVIIEE